jgi:CHAD domain-containing protein
LTGELAPARDLDVYMKSTVHPLRGTVPAKRGLQELESELASRRRDAFRKAKEAVESPRYRSLLLDTLDWLENGSWARRARARGHRRIERFAADILTRRTKKAMKKAKKLRELDAQQRHELRIAIKKLRYASDFFENLFTGRGAARRLSDFENHLKRLQDRLGALNDIAVHQKLTPKLVGSDTRTEAKARTFAAGVVSGHEQAELGLLLKAAARESRKFAHARPFWT